MIHGMEMLAPISRLGMLFNQLKPDALVYEIYAIPDSLRLYIS